MSDLFIELTTCQSRLAVAEKERNRLEREIIAEQHQTAHWLEVAQDMQTRSKGYLAERDSANAHAESAEKAVVDFSKRLAAAEKERDDLDAAEVKYLDIIHQLEIEIEKVKPDLAHEEALFDDYDAKAKSRESAKVRAEGRVEAFVEAARMYRASENTENLGIWLDAQARESAKENHEHE